MDFCWHCELDFPDYLEGEYSVLRDAILVHDVQRCSEELEQCMLSLEQEPCGPEEPSICVRELVSDGDDECYETVGPRLAERPLFSGK